MPPSESVTPAPSVAVNFRTEGYDTSGPRLMGRQSAGEGFLTALAAHGTSPFLGCITGPRDAYDFFDGKLQANARARRETRWIQPNDQDALAQFDIFYNPDPDIPGLAWRRRMLRENAYSLCGITHTIAGARATQGIADLLIAPLHPWDALICTSEAVKASTVSVIDAFSDYLGRRMGATRPSPPELPVIPLGVDTARFAARPAARASWRKKLGIEDCIVFLFLGRLSFHAKAHPLPMYLGLEDAARRSGKKVALIQAGWFGVDGQEKVFADGARQFCPSVKSIFLDGRKPAVRDEIWHAADVFISLPDNIQETFGLTPIEAMAAGLPVIASDWDGYRQTLEHGVTGLMVPTAMAQESAGVEIAQRYFDGLDDYNAYLGATTQVVAVDVKATADACLSLIENDQLRAAMGERGRRRAAETFDWRHIIARYEELWTELSARRRAAGLPAAANASDGLPPQQGNPLRIFANYATTIVGDEARLALAVSDAPARLDAVLANPMNNIATHLLMPVERRRAMLGAIGAEPGISISQLLERQAPKNPDRLRRTVMWLLKCGLIALV